jgi:hypothetical protein
MGRWLFLLLLVMVWSVGIGAVSIPIPDVLAILLKQVGWDIACRRTAAGDGFDRHSPAANSAGGARWRCSRAFREQPFRACSGIPWPIRG